MSKKDTSIPLRCIPRCIPVIQQVGLLAHEGEQFFFRKLGKCVHVVDYVSKKTKIPTTVNSYVYLNVYFDVYRLKENKPDRDSGL